MQGAARIIGVDINELKREKGLAFGMTDFIKTDNHRSVSELIKDSTNGMGVDYCFECSGVESLVNESLEATKMDYYKILEVGYNASDENIKLNYRRLALKWHPDKHNSGGSHVTAKFQEINEAYEVLSYPAKRLDYDLTGICEVDKYTLPEYLGRFRGMILTCNGLGISHASTWSQQLVETDSLAEQSAL